MENSKTYKEAPLDIRQSRRYAEFLSQIGWKVEKLGVDFVYIKKIPILGSAIKLQRAKKIDLASLALLEKKYRAFQTIVEPEEHFDTSFLAKNGFKISNSPFLPTKTLRIDISKSEEEIIKQMKKDGRYSLRKSAECKVHIETSLRKFRNDWFLATGYKRHILPLKHLEAFKKSFKSNMVLFTWEEDFSKQKKGDQDGLPSRSKGVAEAGLPAKSRFAAQAGGMFLVSGSIAYYWIGFTSDLARDKLVQYQVLWSGIKWAKEKGARYFDFEGIYDERFPIKGWQGFTHFKKSFGGEEVVYPGCFVKQRIPL